MIRTPLVMPQLMLRIHSPNRDAIVEALSIAPGAQIELPSRMRFLFLCFTNRSGSAYLIDLLATAGITAQALETLNAAAVLSYCREYGVQSLQTYFEHIVRRDARDNIYIVKVATEQLRLLTEAGILSQIGDSAEFLFMHRADKLGQAISRTIAEQNNRWGWNSPSDFPDDRLEYSAERITQHIYDIGILNQAFDEFFAFNGITPISVEYERLRSQPQHELDEIAGRLRLPAATFDPARLTSRQQANAINHSWRSRFLQETVSPPGTTPGRSLPGCRPQRWSAPSRQTSLPMFATSGMSLGPAGPGWGGKATVLGLRVSASSRGTAWLQMTSNTVALITLGGCCRGCRPELTVERAA